MPALYAQINRSAPAGYSTRAKYIYQPIKNFEARNACIMCSEYYTLRHGRAESLTTKPPGNWQLTGDGKMKNILFYAFPGQTEEVRIGLGRTVWIMEDGEEHPRSINLKGTEKGKLMKYAEELSPSSFIKRFPPLPGSDVYRENKRRVIDGRPEYRTEKDLILRSKIEEYLKYYATHYQLEDVAKLLNIIK